MTLSWAWRERATPLAYAGVLARGEVAEALWRQVAGARHLRGVSGPGFLVALGEPIPWVDGLDHLGREPGLSLAWWPTRLEPALPAELVARAVARDARIALPAVITPWLVVPLDGVRALADLQPPTASPG